MNNVNLPGDLYFSIKKFMVLFGFYLQSFDETTLAQMGELYAVICRGIQSKSDAQERRRLYTEYKNHPDADIREYARQSYLDKAGVHASFRWGADVDPSNPDCNS
jgi:hypothetical protein